LLVERIQDVAMSRDERRVGEIETVRRVVDSRRPFDLRSRMPRREGIRRGMRRSWHKRVPQGDVEAGSVGSNE
jgi:hypothetical protein